MVAFLLDEDIHPRAAPMARGLGLDVVSVHELGRQGLDDWEQLDFAVSEHRTLVTLNRDDFIKLTLDAYRAGKPHFGVLIAPYSIPNKTPEAIARSLKAWHDRWSRPAKTNPYFIDFLARE